MDENELNSWSGNLAHDQVHIADMAAVQEYLSLHPSLAAQLSRITHDARLAFPLPAELSLELYNDPEIADMYLTLYIRLDQYSDPLIRKIDELSAHCDARAAADGTILVTTDFKEPQVAHVV